MVSSPATRTTIHGMAWGAVDMRNTSNVLCIMVMVSNTTHNCCIETLQEGTLKK